MQSEKINELAAALAKVQAKLSGAKKDSKNPFFKASYADLESVWDSCRIPLSENGLCVIQTTDVMNQQMVLITTLAHVSGQFISGQIPLLPVKNDPQAIGSAITYARRYALAAIVGIVQTDDDGESAMNRNAPPLPAGDIPAETRMPAPAPAAPPAAQGIVPLCLACGTQLKVSKAGTAYYCPNFKQPAKTEHTRFPVGEFDSWMGKNAGIKEDDVK